MKKRTSARLPVCLASALAAAAGCQTQTTNSGPSNTRQADTQTPCISPAPDIRDVVRFLEQSTFGTIYNANPALDLAQQVQCEGESAFLTAQFAAMPSVYTTASSSNPPIPVSNNAVSTQFFDFALTAPDQLRLRVAFMLSEILVTSQVKLTDFVNYHVDMKTGVTFNAFANASASYQNVLINGAFGQNADGSPMTYSNLLYNVSLSPAMGHYLDMVNNYASDTVPPNENYAREIMQLFSLGTVKLTENGSVATGANAGPTYTQTDIETLAHIFTGWTYYPATTKFTNAANFTAPMVPINSMHYYSATPTTLLGKTFTWNIATGGGPDANADLLEALGIIYEQTTLPPFLCKQFIQHLVTSNPIPAQISRCVQTFKNDGNGVRGNMQAVISEILLDNQARGVVQNAVAYGHLREPALFVPNVLRLLQYQSTNGSEIGLGLNAQTSKMGQPVFAPPTVFNYFSPSYPLPGSTTLVGPEFGIENTASVIDRANFVNSLLYNIGAIAANTAITLPTAPAVTDAISMTAWLNQYMLHGSMATDLQTYMTGTALNGLTGVPLVERGIYLIGTSSQYKIER